MDEPEISNVTPVDQTAQEIVSQALAEGKTVLCSMMVAVGSTVVILFPDKKTLQAQEVGAGEMLDLDAMATLTTMCDIALEGHERVEAEKTEG